ncbi:MAG: hypothetical protein A3C85_01665 [Candidatus Doudnabacteria bacterium RIFCSPHIGHO2_02_FULL_48_21]|nr:MAG: hypothetical protein A3K05_02630 [Candidatus Doudnabacteria bacterium RIFCSPHIGHO2_01_48_18]OGE77471.1 MAG: hypothetical protein A2668_04290 [Candidatus Doudnabacteria bacterium RIFCSPHIGHO2_01_FULL_48_180]OGE91550.1 MAG: hypothetical protein A3F44_03950 [Candidatus Doudnabacteria bacterium RIFCSPHIGHO2_12_FULL_47_25]OGE93140.1 MAG: hypothetical protein A3C85_01665 [Candidatus Doudnabacteria bacterium RIFCSPHIGHO2_02_FULL_48_21]OGE97262.1 MAG: hypothetical protein A3A83_01475 [Candidatu
MAKKIKKGRAEDNGNSADDYNNYLHTFDLGAAASLVSAGFELVSLDKTNRKKVQFIFRREIGIEKVVDDYWSDRLEVKARSFFDNLKMLKNRLYSE